MEVGYSRDAQQDVNGTTQPQSSDNIFEDEIVIVVRSFTFHDFIPD